MATAVNSFKTTRRSTADRLAQKTVMIADRDFQTLRRCAMDLEAAGFGLILSAGDLDAARAALRKDACDLLLVDPTVGGDLEQTFSFIRSERAERPHLMAAVMTDAPSILLCHRAARAGVSDLWVKGQYFSVAKLAVKLFESQRERPRDALGFAAGLFSSVGVTRGELAILREFSNGYPKQQEIARRLQKDNVYIRKVFSRVYKKIEPYFPVNNQAQLSHLMTVCSLFE